MNFEDLKENLAGQWTGRYILTIQPGNPEHTSQTNASIINILRDKFIQINYTWKFEDNEEEGSLIIGYVEKTKRIVGSWIDTWHQSSDFMICEGYIDEDSIIMKGSYEVAEGPKWDWLTEIISQSPDSFTLEMYNKPPQSTKYLAVKANYHRVK